MAHVTVKADNPISLNERTKQLQYIADTLTDKELSNLHELAKSPKMRNMLTSKFSMLKAFA